MLDATCFECGKPATHAHHVVPKSKGGTRTIPLCLECHSKIHGRQLVHIDLIRNGVARAKAMGKYKGRKAGTTKAKPARARELRASGLTIAEVCQALGISKATAIRYLKAA